MEPEELKKARDRINRLIAATGKNSEPLTVQRLVHLVLTVLKRHPAARMDLIHALEDRAGVKLKGRADIH